MFKRIAVSVGFIGLGVMFLGPVLMQIGGAQNLSLMGWGVIPVGYMLTLWGLSYLCR